MSNLVDVKWLRTVVAVVLLSIWMPATMCCALERAGVPFFDKCCEDDSADGSQQKSCTDKACCLLESGRYLISNPTPLLVTPDIVLCFIHQAIVGRPDDPRTPCRIPESSPPDLPVTWHFSHRAALPVRAPSIAS